MSGAKVTLSPRFSSRIDTSDHLAGKPVGCHGGRFRQALDVMLSVFLPLVRFMKLLRYFDPRANDSNAPSLRTVASFGPFGPEKTTRQPCNSTISWIWDAQDQRDEQGGGLVFISHLPIVCKNDLSVRRPEKKLSFRTFPLLFTSARSVVFTEPDPNLWEQTGFCNTSTLSLVLVWGE